MLALDAGKLAGEECVQTNQKTYYSCQVTSSTLVVYAIPIPYLRSIFHTFPEMEHQIT